MDRLETGIWRHASKYGSKVFADVKKVFLMTLFSRDLLAEISDSRRSHGEDD